MKPSVVNMGKHFGMLGKVYGEYRFALAPNEQSAFKGFISDAFIKPFYNYIWRDWYYFLPQALTCYLIYDWAKKKNHELNKKNPADYANDE
ncbi:hypothetical protein AB6A40_010029 [Gnathostoma spinigerum]|uniref:Cytochrome b-c1 complex subunit 8 n=1 Tax=Gnathostoma spinigerum TaxID=75299 RepID=A0ABD6EUY5_9BILA